MDREIFRRILQQRKIRHYPHYSAYVWKTYRIFTKIIKDESLNKEVHVEFWKSSAPEVYTPDNGLTIWQGFALVDFLSSLKYAQTIHKCYRRRIFNCCCR